MFLRRTVSLLLLLIFCISAEATTWVQAEVSDPINGSKCTVHEPLSYGSYIYDWPSKYDGVYWPHTDHHWIWRCPESGYISFGDDFADLDEDEIEKITTHLRDKSNREGTDFERLEAIYRLRNKDDQFWAWFYRVKAAVLSGQANEARHAALGLMEESIESIEPGFELIQLYFVIGDYHRRFGDFDAARDAFEKARKVEWIDEDGVDQVGSEYIEALIVERLELID